MTLSTKKRQIALKAESSEGTAESLTASEADYLVEADSISYEPLTETETRNLAQSSKSGHAALINRLGARIRFAAEVKGSGTIATKPKIVELMEACACAATAVKKLAIGAVTSGPFTHGEVITGGTSSATGRLIGQVSNGDAALYVVVTSGTFQDAETLTGGTSSASATAGAAPADGGFVVEPVSSGDSSYTVAVYHDGKKKVIQGARGTFSLSMDSVGKRVMANFEFVGAEVAEADVALLSGITYETGQPPVARGGDLRLDSTTTLNLRSLSQELGNTLALRPDFTSSSGYKSAKAPSRAPTLSMQVEDVLVATFDWRGKHRAGTEIELEWGVGSTEANRFRLVCPAWQITGIGEADEDTISLLDLSGQLNGNTDYADEEFSLLFN